MTQIKTKNQLNNIFVHSTAIIEKDVSIGNNTSIWDNVHIRRNTSIGHDCIIGEKTYVAYDVKIGNFVKINASVYICTGVTIKDKVMLSAGVIFTNDKFPRAFSLEDDGLADSGPTEETVKTLVEEGATIGANSTIIGDNVIGAYSMIGAGSVVTKSVLPYALYYGVPAKFKGWVCKCGSKLHDIKGEIICERCVSVYVIKSNCLKKIK